MQQGNGRKAKAREPQPGVVGALDAELEVVAVVAPALARGALAASLRVLAERMDDRSNSATSVAACAKAFQEGLERLRGLMPPPATRDGVDELAAARAKRRAGQPTPAR